MRYARWLLLLSVLPACADDDPLAPADASVVDGGAKPSDAGTTTKPDASTSKLPKPALPRPSSDGLPAELRPPR